MATYYVDYSVAVSGDGSLASPWKSVTDIDETALAAGDTIKIDKNTDIDVSGGYWTFSFTATTTDFIRIISADKNDSWNYSPGAKIDAKGSQTYTALLDGNARYFFIKGIEFSNATSNNVRANSTSSFGFIEECIASNAGNVGFFVNRAVLINCSAHNCAYGFFSYASIFNCLASNCASYGMHAENAVVSSVVYGCGTGFRLDNTATLSGCVISDCTTAMLIRDPNSSINESVIRDCDTGINTDDSVCVYKTL